MTIRFDSGRHEQLLASLRDATAGIGRHLDALEDAVRDGRDAWHGTARDAYDDAQQAWTAAMTTMRSILAEADTAAAASGAALRRADEAATKLWG